MKGLIVGICLFLFCNVSSQKIEIVKRDAILLLEDIHKAVWASDFVINHKDIAVKLKQICDKIESYKGNRVPPSIIPKDFERYMNDIDSKYNEFSQLLRQCKTKSSTVKWKAFENSVKGNNSYSFEKTFKAFIKSVYNHEETGAFRNEILIKFPKVYTMGQSEENAIYNLYTLAQTAQLKAYTMVQVLFSLLDPNQDKAEHQRELFYFAMKSQHASVKTALSPAKTCFRKLFVKWKEDETYFTDHAKTLHVIVAPQVSDVRNNKVIVGMRLNKTPIGQVYIEIKQGTLLPGGEIDPLSVDWVPVNINSSNPDDPTKKKSQVTVTENFSKWFLDDLSGPENTLLTGVSLAIKNGGLYIRMRSTGFSFSKGLLEKNLSLSNWHDNFSKAKRQKLWIMPKKSFEKVNMDYIYSGQEIGLDYTKPNGKSINSWFPFYDKNLVMPDPPVPLSGLGVHLKGAYVSPGMIGLKVYTSEIYDYFNPPPLPFKKHFN